MICPLVATPASELSSFLPFMSRDLFSRCISPALPMVLRS